MLRKSFFHITERIGSNSILGSVSRTATKLLVVVPYRLSFAPWAKCLFTKHCSRERLEGWRLVSRNIVSGTEQELRIKLNRGSGKNDRYLF